MRLIFSSLLSALMVFGFASSVCAQTPEQEKEAAKKANDEAKNKPCNSCGCPGKPACSKGASGKEK